MILALLLHGCAPADRVEDFGSNPGNLAMYEHVPADAAGPLPLVLFLHGCTQDASAAESAGFLERADAAGFLLVIAEQRRLNNPNLCFDWFRPEDTARGSGEAASLMQMIDDASARHDVDRERIFVAGMSAGAAMSVAMLAAYPDVFAGGMAFAGVPYGCADTLAAATGCLAGTSAGTADDVRAAGTWGGPWPRLLVVHGDDDAVVDPANAGALAAQWAELHGSPAVTTTTVPTTVGDATVEVHGERAVEIVRIPGLGHAVPVAPDAGCGERGWFQADIGWCAAGYAAGFFGI